LIDSNQFRQQNGRLPRYLMAKINRLAHPRSESKRCQNENLPNQRRSHYLLNDWRISDARSGVKYLL
jgi:hypothetical protein